MTLGAAIYRSQYTNRFWVVGDHSKSEMYETLLFIVSLLFRDPRMKRAGKRGPGAKLGTFRFADTCPTTELTYFHLGVGISHYILL